MPNFYAGDRVRGEPWFEAMAGELGAVVEAIGLELCVDIIVVFDRPVTILNHTRRRFQHSAHNFAHVEEMPMSDDDPRAESDDSESEYVTPGMVLLSEFMTTGAHYETFRAMLPMFGGRLHQVARIQKRGQRRQRSHRVWSRSMEQHTVYSSRSAAHRTVCSEGRRVPRSIQRH